MINNMVARLADAWGFQFVAITDVSGTVTDNSGAVYTVSVTVGNRGQKALLVNNHMVIQGKEQAAEWFASLIW